MTVHRPGIIGAIGALTVRFNLASMAGEMAWAIIALIGLVVAKGKTS